MKDKRDICGVPTESNVVMASFDDVLVSSYDMLSASDEKIPMYAV